MPTTHDAYEQSQSAALIEQSLGRLNARYRAALVRKDLHGLGGDELAEVLEVSRPAAHMLVHRARASVKKAFAGLAGEGFVAPANLALALSGLLPRPRQIVATGGLGGGAERSANGTATVRPGPRHGQGGRAKPAPPLAPRQAAGLTARTKPLMRRTPSGSAGAPHIELPADPS